MGRDKRQRGAFKVGSHYILVLFSLCIGYCLSFEVAKLIHKYMMEVLYFLLPQGVIRFMYCLDQSLSVRKISYQSNRDDL